VTGQYYYQAFLPGQPDLDWRDPHVRRGIAADDRVLAHPTRSAYGRFLVFFTLAGLIGEGQQRVDSSRLAGRTGQASGVDFWPL